ncbi:RNA polymerase sigma factor RpoD/SigA [Prevotellamassilia timonensis]|uniref:sigma-70 family RNA polymerase sigma factor n=1 Tax=Prevotellamassilia timonensis TaxID=1852370 RepID=UPI00258D8678|nr:RNA polymerase sigma factor RpoD/SigA [uncultured Prevotellamassilia sp.]MBD8977587.1 RNA polymerase sigma factor RpoD/SigA [Prevotellamassilia timonensis]
MRQLKITVAITSRGSEALERYLQDISKEEMVSTDEEVELAKRIRQGDKNALERLVKANLRFVVSVAKQYQGQGLELTDLINEGNVGLINAAMKFDETRGFKFISYAVWWVRQSILQALADKSRLVRLPLNQIGYVSKVNHFYHDFMQKNNRAPSLDEVADALGMEKSKVNAALLTSGKHISMNAPLIDDEDSCLLDLLTNDDKGNADSSLISDSLKEEVHHALDLLPERESQVIRMYFGINTPELSLEEIGEKLNLSRERVRQIKEKALTLLRNAQIGSVLKEYL